jgi:hypothetical protein
VTVQSVRYQTVRVFARPFTEISTCGPKSNREGRKEI